MIDIAFMFFAAAVGCFAALATGGRVIASLAAAPLLGLLQGVLLLFGADIAARLPPDWALVVTSLNDPALLIAAIVATAVGALLTGVGMRQVDIAVREASAGGERPNRKVAADRATRPRESATADGPEKLIGRLDRIKAGRRNLGLPGHYNAVATPLSSIMAEIDKTPSLAQYDSDFPDNRRRNRRRGTLIPGILVDGANVYVRCVIRNRSPTGALVKLDPGGRAVEPGWLIDTTNAIAHRVERRWRVSMAMGLAIERTVNLKGPVDDEAVRLVALLRVIDPDEAAAAAPPSPSRPSQIPPDLATRQIH
jgi:hypothetical protein